MTGLSSRSISTGIPKKVVTNKISQKMELKKFISTLKGCRTRFTNKPNAELEKKSVENLAEKFGGKLEAIASLKEAGEIELKDYLKRVLGISNTTPNSAPVETAPKVGEAKSEEEKPKPAGKVVSKDEDGTEYAMVNGEVYQIDSVKKTMKRVYKSFKELATADLDLVSDRVMPLTTYQRYLRDTFPGEDMPIKKGKLHFRGYRISCNAEDGFIVEDTTKYYAIVETPFEGIPTPKELGEWFKKPGGRKISSEECQKAIERGKELARKAKEERERNLTKDEEEPDFEALRKKVFMLIADARSKTIDVDPEKFTEMIPFKRWKRKVKSLYTQWKDRKIRYAKFLNEIETLTKEETFVVEEKRHRSSFTGTLMPEHKTVGMLVGDKIEVDGKWIDAVPFLLEYLLFYEKRAMSQIMKYAAGEISDVELIKNPMEVDWKVEYKKRALKNTAHNARVLCMVYDQVGIVAPQDLLYEADLQAGDRIMIVIDGELKTRTVSSVERGIVLGKEIGLLKLDKWIKLPKKETKDK